MNQARLEASALVEDARADAEVEKTTIARQIKELERQRDSVASYLEEMRGVLGNVIPQAPEFSDVINAALATGVPQAAGRPEAASSGSADSAGSAGSADSPARAQNAEEAASPVSPEEVKDAGDNSEQQPAEENLLSLGGRNRR